MGSICGGSNGSTEQSLASNGIEDLSTTKAGSICNGSNGSPEQNLASNGNEDPLLAFLRLQHHCIKGGIDQFYAWLVKSEDIDSIATLKEVVSDDEYLEGPMKVGCGSIGLEGFKRMAFWRAIGEYCEGVAPAGYWERPAIQALALLMLATATTQLGTQHLCLE